MKKVSVIGLGYVGLPLAALCAKRGYETVGLEANPGIVKTLTAGGCHIRDAVVESMLSEANATGNFRATNDASDIAD